MPPATSPQITGYRQIIGMAWPVIVASISTPLLGLVDTAVIGRTDTAAALGAIAVGSLMLTFIYWAFGFLRMSTTGFIAQAEGAGDQVDVRVVSLRALLLGAALGVVLFILQIPLVAMITPILGAEGEVRELVRTYFDIRIWAAPATLVTYALTGIFIGLGKTRLLLALQLLLNGLNIVLDVALAGWLEMGVRGIAIGTLIAEWVAAVWGLWLVYRLLRSRHQDEDAFLPWKQVIQGEGLRRTMTANGNIMVRTLAMLAGMTWFTRQGAQLGETVLAANHVLIGIISFCAFFMDGVAFSTEALTGAAKGRRDLPGFDLAVRRTSEIALGLGLLLAGALFVSGEHVIRLLTDLPNVIDVAAPMLPFIAISIGAFQMDGIFIGTTFTREMRNGAVLATALFITSSAVLVPLAGLSGLWSAMLIWTALRGLTLACYFPRIRQHLGPPPN